MTSQVNMINLICSFRNLCLQRYPEDIDVLSKEDRDGRLGIAVQSKLYRMLRVGKSAEPIEEICRLAKTPRLLKLILRRTYLVWEGLHGEIDFDDMFVANTIRFGAPEAFEFILEHHEAIRGLQTEGVIENRNTRLKDVEDKWERTTEAVRWDVASAKSLTQFLFPSWHEGRSSQKAGLPQFIRFPEPSDYWSRYLAEELDPGTIRDQEVLHVLAAWRVDAHSAHFRNATLPSILCSDKEFTDKFESFAPVILNGQDIRQIATATFEQALDLQGVKTYGKSTVGFIPLWRLAIRQPIDESMHLEWVKEEIFKALPRSLRFANDLYYYWSSNSESDTRRRSHLIELYSQVVNYAKEIFQGKPDEFIRAIDPLFMYSSTHFCVLNSEPDQGGTGFIAADWHWFFELLLDAGKIDPQTIAPQIACLLIDEQHHPSMRDDRDIYSFKEALAQDLFGEEMSRLMYILSTEINIDQFELREKRRIQTAHDFATEWLKNNLS